MQWCDCMEMWCMDMDVIDLEEAGCDGECDNCYNCTNK